MPTRPRLFPTACAWMLLAAGCGEPTPPSAEAPPATGPADRWLGQWNGPEGTFLRLDGGDGRYRVTIQNLDGPRTFSARAVGDGIRFERDGIEETVRASTGRETGMKWLDGKSDCLRVRPGEGYCRD